jgi:thiosulfate dehydrogenase [quinone] large subunit
MKTSLINGAQWAAVLRIGLGLWWLESFRHKNLEAWIKRQAGINWAADIAAKHKIKAVGKGFDAVVKPHPKAMTWIILMSELSLGLGLTLLYFVLMIHDWAEQGQNAMMILAAVVILGLHGWQVWSIDHLIHIFGA